MESRGVPHGGASVDRGAGRVNDEYPFRLSALDRELGNALAFPAYERVRFVRSAPGPEPRYVVVERIAEWLFAEFEHAEWGAADDYARNVYRLRASDLLRGARVPVMVPSYAVKGGR